MSQYALGHFLTLKTAQGTITHRFQNFYIQQTVDGHSFMPFGFSGVSVNRSGDNVDASLTFPNNQIARGWIDEALRSEWIAQVSVRIMLDPGNPAGGMTTLHDYVGQASAGGWDEVAVIMRLNSIIDAVGGEVPARSLHQRLVGALPISGNLVF